jgi:hypothetical protein
MKRTANRLVATLSCALVCVDPSLGRVLQQARVLAHTVAAPEPSAPIAAPEDETHMKPKTKDEKDKGSGLWSWIKFSPEEDSEEPEDTSYGMRAEKASL